MAAVTPQPEAQQAPPSPIPTPETPAVEVSQERSRQALPGSRLNAFSMDPQVLTIIGLDTADKSSSDHYLHDSRVYMKLDEGLVRNVYMMGILLPVLVVKEGERILVSEGRQRVRAAREVNLRISDPEHEWYNTQPPVKVPCMAKRGDPKKHFAITVSANENRIDDDLMTKAGKLDHLLDLGYSDEDAAVVFGVEEPTIKEWKKLLELAPKVQEAIKAGKIAASAAIKLYGLPIAEQEAKLAEAIAEGKVSKADLAAKRAEAKPGGPVKPKHPRPSQKMIGRLFTWAKEKNKISKDGQYVLAWANGEVPNDELATVFEIEPEFFKPKPKVKAKKK